LDAFIPFIIGVFTVLNAFFSPDEKNEDYVDDTQIDGDYDPWSQKAFLNRCSSFKIGTNFIALHYF
jgi:hypothetical protein